MAAHTHRHTSIASHPVTTTRSRELTAADGLGTADLRWRLFCLSLGGKIEEAELCMGRARARRDSLSVVSLKITIHHSTQGSNSIFKWNVFHGQFTMWNKRLNERNSIPERQKSSTDRDYFSFSLLKLKQVGRFGAKPDVCVEENQNEFTRVPFPQLFGRITHSIES